MAFIHLVCGHSNLANIGYDINVPFRIPFGIKQSYGFSYIPLGGLNGCLISFKLHSSYGDLHRREYALTQLTYDHSTLHFKYRM